MEMLCELYKEIARPDWQQKIEENFTQIALCEAFGRWNKQVLLFTIELDKPEVYPVFH